MPDYTVTQGECLASIAEEQGLAHWNMIYDAAANAHLKRKRLNANLMLPKDEVFVPERTPKEEDGASERKHRFRLKCCRTFLTLMLRDEEGQPLGGKNYRLIVDHVDARGKTGSDGRVQQMIPARAQQGLLIVWLDDRFQQECTWELGIGHLDPIDTLTGLQARLNNLGFDSGAVDGIDGPNTRGAVKAFQKKYGLAIDGIPGPQTQAKLKDVYGC